MIRDQLTERSSPLVSVVTPAYNAMPYIKETVRSVAEQQYPNIQHIVMDGGSTDGTVEFLREHSELIWISEPDRGQSHALNKGFAQANGVIIGWLNADDLYQPGAVSVAVQFLLENEDVDLVYGDLQIINEASEPVGLSTSRPFNVKELLDSNFIKQPTVFMRKRVLDMFTGVDEHLHYTMDQELWLRAGMGGVRMHYLENHILASFRLCPGTKSFDDTPEFRIEWLNVLENLPSAEYKDPAFWQRRRNALRRTKSQCHVANIIKALEQRDRKTVFDELFQAIRQDATLILNRGVWKFAGMGILGMSPDRMRKYSKNSQV